jgi:hypothetical protein
VALRGLSYILSRGRVTSVDPGLGSINGMQCTSAIKKEGLELHFNFDFLAFVSFLLGIYPNYTEF